MRRFRWTFAMLTVVLGLAACASNASTSPPGAGAGPSVSSATTPSLVSDPLEGTWRSTYTCDDIVKALDRAGLQTYEANVVPKECDGVMHATLTFGNGTLTITGDNGKANPPIPYQVVNDRTFVGGFVRNTYRIQGNRLIFTDTQIIKALYPYDPKLLPGEQAGNVGFLESVPFELVG
jgi:hypothetical protein